MARVEVPATSKVEEAESEEVAVIDPPVIVEELIVVILASVEVRVEIVPVTAFRKEEKRLVDDAVREYRLDVVALLSVVSPVTLSEEAVVDPVVEVPDTRVPIVALVAVRLVKRALRPFSKLVKERLVDEALVTFS